MATGKKIECVEVPEIKIEEMDLVLIGDKPLIMHKWSEKAKREILEKQLDPDKKRQKEKKEPRDPWMEFCSSMYWKTPMPERPTREDIENAVFQFPVTAFKASAVDASYQQGLFSSKTMQRGAVHVSAPDGSDFVEIESSIPAMREDMIRVNNRNADFRYRGEFKNWRTTIRVKYNPVVLSQKQVINLFNYGGFACGVGEWRPQKNGVFGTYHVATIDEL